MSFPIIRVENLGKKYRIHHQQAGKQYVALRDVLVDGVKRLLRPAPRANRPAVEDFWALKEFSLEVKQGEVLGVIGRNGAGKSTLLKILSRITEPTTGRVTLNGRVASLLEVGTGFHPELTGRENVFLNGSILGMTRVEILKKFDEIVAFAEVEKFLDTPVKRYSSGMYVRLAFAVAAHLEPEILVVDEVLAVGDAQFQKKCLGTISSVSKASGRTVLLVSHNMAAVEAICTRAVSLRQGRLVKDGEPSAVIADYLASALDTPMSRRWTEADCPQDEYVALYEVTAAPPPGEPAIDIDTGLNVQVVFQNKRDGVCLDCNIYVANNQGVMMFESGALLEPAGKARAGRYRMNVRIPGHLLNAGRYHVNVLFGLNQSYMLLKVDEVVAFDVENTVTGRGSNMHVTQGVIRPLLSWKQDFFGQ